VTDVSRLQPLAEAISTSSSRIRAWALEQTRVTLEQEERLRKLEVVPAPTPVPDPVPPASRFGIAWGAGRPTLQRCQEMAAVGDDWIRFEVEWTNIEPTKGAWNWAAYDQAIRDAEAAGLKVLPILSTTPGWARVTTAPTFAGDAHWKPPAVDADYGTFCVNAVNRYKPGGVAGTNVTHYELGNEYNLARFCGGLPANPEKYAAMLKAAVPRMRLADPDCLIVTAGMSPAGYGYGFSGSGNINGLNYIERVFAAGALDFDAIGWHPYGAAGFADGQAWSPWFQMYGTTPSVRSILTRIGRPDVPIWLTEYGDSTVPGWGGQPVTNPISETTAANRLTDAYRRHAAFTFPVGPLFYFTFRSGIGDAAGFSMVDPVSGAQRPRYAAFKTAAA
jgi:hypothetical protein